MKESTSTGVFQLKNGYWGFRYVISVNGQRKEGKRTRDEQGLPYKTEKQAARAREKMIIKKKSECDNVPVKIVRRTVRQIYAAYAENGRAEKAYSTKTKQDSLWKVHIEKRFGNQYIDEIRAADIQDYLAELYYTEGYGYSYVESFLKMFYLIYGQAYARGSITYEEYNRMCIDKATKIHMPKIKINEETDIVVFDKLKRKKLDEYFEGTNAETAYKIGKYCGLRIAECYGLKWSNVNLDKGYIYIDRQMQYQRGLIKLVPVKTRNARREVYLSAEILEYLRSAKERIEWANQNLEAERRQNQTLIEDIDGQYISSTELVNCLENGKIQTVNSMKYHAVKIRKKFKFEFKYHYLRHTYGTILASANTPVYILCKQMGHGNSNVTQKYYLGKSEIGLDALKKNLKKL